MRSLITQDPSLQTAPPSQYSHAARVLLCHLFFSHIHRTFVISVLSRSSLFLSLVCIFLSHTRARSLSLSRERYQAHCPTHKCRHVCLSTCGCEGLKERPVAVAHRHTHLEQKARTHTHPCQHTHSEPEPLMHTHTHTQTCACTAT